MKTQIMFPLQDTTEGGSGAKGSDGTQAGAAAAGTVVGDAAAAKAASDAAAAAAAGKGADGKGTAAPETGGKDGTAQPAPKAPEKYELKMPDGGRLNAADRDYVEQVARKSNWTNEQAQAALNEQDRLVLEQSTRFRATTEADPDYGGVKLQETQQLALKVINRIRPEGHARRASFLEFINRGGAGNHIEVVSFLADLGRLMAEDGVVGGKGGASGPVDAASKLYPDTKGT
jgi:hypothetical protein